MQGAGLGTEAGVKIKTLLCSEICQEMIQLTTQNCEVHKCLFPIENEENLLSRADLIGVTIKDKFSSDLLFVI